MVSRVYEITYSTIARIAQTVILFISDDIIYFCAFTEHYDYSLLTMINSKIGH